MMRSHPDGFSLLASFPRFDIVATDRGWPCLSYGEREGAAVLPVWRDGSVLLVEQERPFVRAVAWEAPRGGAEPGESPAQCAARELREETGALVAPADLFPLGVVHPDSGTLASRMPCFLALLPEGLAPAPQPDGEILRARRFAPAELGALLLSGSCACASTLAMLALWGALGRPSTPEALAALPPR